MLLIRYSIVLMVTVTSVSTQIQAQTKAPEIQAKNAFDTRYVTSDTRIVAFDDGSKTYVALPTEIKSQPVAVSVQTGREVLIPVTSMSPYWLLDGIHAKIKLVWSNNKIVLITYTGTITETKRLGEPVAFGHVQPASIHGASPAPVLVTSTAAAEIATEVQLRLQQIAELDKSKADALINSNISKASSADPFDEKQKAQSLITQAASSPQITSVTLGIAKNAHASHVPTLTIEAGQHMSTALRAWLALQGVGLIWDVSAGAERQRDIEFISAWQSPSVDIEQTLQQLLPAFGLRAIVQDSPRTVIIRAASGTPSKSPGASK